MKRIWTERQADAISARGGSVLVSAAAGSGKTAVLVQRVIEMLTDEKNPVSASRLLIVTFTRAAAGEMRQRISDAVEKLIAEKPDDANLVTQQMLLPSAKICTIDSFCNSLVRDNFQLADISPDFKNADEGELSLLKAQAMEQTLEQMYLEDDGDFSDLVEILFKGRDDGNLADMIYQLYSDSMSYPFPEEWLGSISQRFGSGEPLSKSGYGKIIIDYAREALVYCLSLVSSMKQTAAGCEGLEKAFLQAVQSDEAQLEYILEKLKDSDWDGARDALLRYEPQRLGRLSPEYKGTFEAESLKASRETVKNVLRKTLPALMCCNEREYLEDMQYLAPPVKRLCEAAKLFSENFLALKKEKNLADFSDISHMAIELLVKPTENGGYEKTELACTVAESFDEILIDEYQDTNKTQDMLFESISRNNLFRVGDVKQSIYRFRRAMPEIFIELKNRYAQYDREKDEYPAKIILGNNFRSRKSVTECVNFIFSQTMSAKAGDIEYGDEEKLVFSAPYPEKDGECAELHLLETAELDRENDSSDAFQARYIADMINDMIDSGFTVSDGGTERRASYRDFCVLLRSVNGGRGTVYAEEFAKCGVPCFTETTANFFSSKEVGLVLSLLRVIDNPKQDVPLLTVLMSVLFGFTVDDTALLRTRDRQSDLYGCLCAAAGDGDEKAKGFLDEISRLRMLSVSMGVEEFIRLVYDETALVYIAGAMRGAAKKKANLLLLLDYASVYEKAGYIGLSGFIGFIDRLQRGREDLPGSAGISADADKVKIMSIHKSKGLEFPICIVANCAGKFNRSDEMSNMIVSSRDGIGLVCRNAETLAQYPTVSHKAVGLSIRNDTVSEEMRVLYVALTRAREKLIMVAALKDVQKTVMKCAVNINPRQNKLTPFSVSCASSYAEWIITAALRHGDSADLRSLAGLGAQAVIPSDFSLKTVISGVSAQNELEKPAEAAAKADEGFLRLIEERCAYRYEYERLTFAVSKRAASEVDKNFVDREYFASGKPAFLCESGLTPAQRGTATHAFMQYADYEKAKISVGDEIERLLESGIITEMQAGAINRRAVGEFFKSGLFARIEKSPLVMREKKFTVSVPASELYPELSDFPEEEVMIQGIADCVFLENGRLIVVDYKTDALDAEEQFREKYAGQVKIYQRALTMCTDYEVSETLLYSFRLGKEIRVD